MKRPERLSGQPQPASTPSAAQPRKAARRSADVASPRERPTVHARQPAQPPERAQRRADRVRRGAERAQIRRFTRRSRRRRIGWISGLAGFGVVSTLVAIAVFSPILALREIRVDGTSSRIDPATIRAAVSGQMGTPLALLDEGRIRTELSQFSSIRSYAVELVPPGTLVIHIVERTPIGIVAGSTGFDVVDAAGVVLESSPTRPAALPLLLIDDEGSAGTGFTSMVAVLVALPPEVLAQVDSIGARTRDDVTLSLTGSQQRVVWGSAEDSERKALVLAALLARFAGAGPGEYDVSAPGSAVFRLD